MGYFWKRWGCYILGFMAREIFIKEGSEPHRDNKRRNTLIIFGIIGILAVGQFGVKKAYHYYQLTKEKVNINSSEFREPQTEKKDQESMTIPEAKVLQVPYTVQAPLTNWNLHEESCEEAALLMYHYFLENQLTFNDKSIITPAAANAEEIKMKEWQVQHYGKEPDLTIAEWGKFAKEYYGYNYQIFTDITKEDIKRQISEGNPVLVPVITHALENPHYGNQPSYHVVVIKGYKPDGVVANDSGVKEGENYFYSWDILFKAIDAQESQMNQGRVMAVLTK